MVVFLVLANMAFAADPLPSWNDTATKKAIITFVDQVTQPGSPNFVPSPERIATFDNDGTLWSEQPMYVQIPFILDQIKAAAPQHPEWKDKQPYKAILEGDMKTVLASGAQTIITVGMGTLTGNTTEEYAKTVSNWLATATHPKTGRLYTEMVYQPMLELLAYLRASGFKTFIVSGGEAEFMRPWTEKVYGIPPEQVIGSSMKTKFQLKDGKPVIMRIPELNILTDNDGKPVGINQYIGRRPIASFGNSDGDIQMHQWTTAGTGLRFALLVHHTDGEREYAYDRNSDMGKLDKALGEAQAKGWIVMDMKKDWKVIYPFEKK
jgi:phosphoglycolate phosphatase-like HAD superfamily hydrolase